MVTAMIWEAMVRTERPTMVDIMMDEARIMAKGMIGSLLLELTFSIFQNWAHNG